MKSIKAIRTLAAALALLLLIPLAACSSGGEPDTTTAPSVTTPAPAETTAPETVDDTPKLAFEAQDYHGAAFHILTCVEADYEYRADEQTGERVNDAIYDRNAAAEEYLNIDLDVIYESGSWSNRATYNNIITQSIQAGDNAYDYVTGMISCIMPIASAQMFVNLFELPNLDMDSPWWVSSMQDELALNGKLFGIIGDVSLSMYKGLSVFFFNQKLVGDYQLEDPYELVRSGAWTVDKMIEMTTASADDLDGDGKWTVGTDRYGAMLYELVWRSLNAALDVHPIHIDETGMPVVDDLDERAINVIEKLTTYLHSGDSIWIQDKDEPARTSFIADLATFYLGKLSEMEKMADMESDFGIIPMPKYDENQAAYYTQVATATQIIFVPVTTGDAAMTGHVLETLSYLTWRDVVAQYYETSLQQRYSRDRATAEMLDIIRAGAVNGFDYTYSTAIAGDPWVNKIVSQYSWQSIAPASAYAAQKKVWEANIEKILESYKDAET